MSEIEIIRPRDRAAWLRARGRDVTASVVGALFGEHEFTTIYELWMMKAGRLPRQDEETPAMQRGRLLEPVAVQLLREMHPDWSLVHNAAENVYFRDPIHRLGGTPDVIATAPGRGQGAVQIKSVEASVFRRKWLDEDGNVEPPLWISLQATLEAYLTGSEWAAVAPLVIGHGLEMPMVEIPIVEGVVDAMKERSLEFWEMVASGNEPQPDYARDAGVIERIYGDGNQFEEVDLTPDNRVPTLLERRRDAKRQITDLVDEVSTIDAEIKSKMGLAHLAHIPGGRKITWKPQRRAGFFVEPTTVRVLRYPQAEKE